MIVKPSRREILAIAIGSIALRSANAQGVPSLGGSFSTSVATSGNLLTKTEVFDNAIWAKTAMFGVTADATTSPTGTTTADKLIPNTTNAQHQVQEVFVASNSQVACLSIYAKAAELTAFNLTLIDRSVGSFPAAIFDLSGGTILGYGSPATTGDGTITSAGNGWYRCTLKTSVGTGASNPKIVIIPRSGGGPTFAGNNSDGFYVWGAQAEISSAPTTYQAVA